MAGETGMTRADVASAADGGKGTARRQPLIRHEWLISGCLATVADACDRAADQADLNLCRDTATNG